jgi:ADP-heptose:LPS heptosyltransferase
MMHPGFPDKVIYLASITLSKLINRGKNPKSLTFERILVIRQDEIGDMCYSLHVFKLIRDQYPNCTLTVWCKPAAAGIIKHDRAISDIVTDKSKLIGKYDLIVDLRGKWAGVIYAFQHSPKYRLERGSIRLSNRKNGQPHEAVTNFEIIKPLLDENAPMPAPKVSFSKEEQESANQFIQENNLRRFAVMHTEVKRELRKWPADRFAATAQLLKDQYNLDIVFCGDSSETDGIKAIQKQIPFSTFSVAGKLNLGGFAAFVSKASFFIGNDSSPLHIATLSGVPSLGLFGPGQSDSFFPLGNNSGYLHHLLPCNPCNQIDCVHPENPCIKRITVKEVQDKIKALLA